MHGPTCGSPKNWRYFSRRLQLPEPDFSARRFSCASAKCKTSLMFSGERSVGCRHLILAFSADVLHFFPSPGALPQASDETAPLALELGRDSCAPAHSLISGVPARSLVLDAASWRQRRNVNFSSGQRPRIRGTPKNVS